MNSDADFRRTAAGAQGRREVRRHRDVRLEGYVCRLGFAARVGEVSTMQEEPRHHLGAFFQPNPAHRHIQMKIAIVKEHKRNALLHHSATTTKEDE